MRLSVRPVPHSVRFRFAFGMLAFAFSAGTGLSAQTGGTETRGFAVGFHLASLGGDMALGLEATSPYFGRGSIAFRGSVDLATRQGYPVDPPSEMTVERYGVARVGLVGVGGLVGGCIRLYGEGGMMAAFPKASFSRESSRLGGYGHFGFEFLMGPREHPRCSYFIELGTVGMDARADRQIGKPVYLNGFSIGTGFRFYL